MVAGREAVTNDGSLKRSLPWLVLLMTIALLVPPAVWLWQHYEIRQAVTRGETLGETLDLGNPGLVAQSANFKILGYESLVEADKAHIFLNRLERVYPGLLEILDTPASDHPVTIIVLPACGVSHGGQNYLTINTCNSHFDDYWSGLVIHELTHTLMNARTSWDPNPIVGEGQAVAMDTRFGWGLPLPDTNRQNILAILRSGQLLPVADIQYGISYNSPLSSLEYLQAGSFASYLIDRYGMPTYLRLFDVNATYESVYSHTYQELAAGWLQSIRMENLIQALLLTLGGAAALGLVHTSIYAGWKWLPAAGVGILALSAWALCCIYNIIPGVGLLLAGTVGSIVAHWRSRLGSWLLWVIGAGSLVAGLLVPAILIYTR